MSKKDELRLLRRQYSIDAPVNAHGRTGESSNVGSMLDLYAHSESAEEILLQRDDEKARKRFEKGFSAYLEHVFTEEERELMRAVLARETSVYTTQDILRAEYIERMEWIQRKAYKNVKPLIALARKTGWSGATEFIKDIYERLKQLSAGADMTDVIPQNKREYDFREKRRQYVRASYAANPEPFKNQVKRFRKAHPDIRSAQTKRYREKHKEELKAKRRRYELEHREEINARQRAYRAAHREEINAKRRVYRAAHYEEEIAKCRAYHAAHREEINAKRREYIASRREEINARARANYRRRRENRENEKR